MSLGEAKRDRFAEMRSEPRVGLHRLRLRRSVANEPSTGRNTVFATMPMKGSSIFSKSEWPNAMKRTVARAPRDGARRVSFHFEGRR